MGLTGSWPTVPKPRRHSLRTSWNRVFSHNHALPMYRTELLGPRKPITDHSNIGKREMQTEKKPKDKYSCKCA